MKNYTGIQTLGKKTAHLISRNILSTGAVLALMGVAAFAAAPTGGYAPGATLDPDCSPGDTDCSVQGGDMTPDSWAMNGANVVVENGNVGIGTDAPVGKLHVSSAGNIPLWLESDSTSVGLRLNANNKNWELFNSPSISNQGFGIYDRTNSVYRLGIDGLNGNVGIGDNTPENKLEVYDNTATSSGSSVIRSKKAYKSGTAGTEYEGSTISGGLGGSFTINQYAITPMYQYDWSSNLEFRVRDTTAGNDSNIDNQSNLNTVMTLDGSNQNVGIGTTTPNAKLEVRNNDASQADNLLYIAQNPTGAEATENTAWIRGETSEIALRVNNYGTGPAAVFNDGNVGIGTTSPSEALEVSSGKIKATGGLIIETRTDDPTAPSDGQIWLRTDI